MKYQLAQLNIAKFLVPMENPANAEFVAAIDLVNTEAEEHPGFVWRLIGDGNNALDINAFDDPNLLINLSVWNDLPALVDFVYRNKDHKDIMSRRKQWFGKMEFSLVLWWLEENRIPTIEEAKVRLALLQQTGPTYSAFTFKHAFAAPSGEIINPFKEGK